MENIGKEFRKVESRSSGQGKLDAYGEGPWVKEPDNVWFEYKGYECYVRRILLEFRKGENPPFGGYLCGYVFLPEEHHLVGTEDFPDFDVHGGVTYSDRIDGKWAIGFDCAHCMDLIPGNVRLPPSPFANPFPEIEAFKSTYKDISFVVGECERLVDQLLEEHEKKA